MQYAEMAEQKAGGAHLPDWLADLVQTGRPAPWAAKVQHHQPYVCSKCGHEKPAYEFSERQKVYIRTGHLGKCLVCTTGKGRLEHPVPPLLPPPPPRANASDLAVQVEALSELAAQAEALSELTAQAEAEHEALDLPATVFCRHCQSQRPRENYDVTQLASAEVHGDAVCRDCKHDLSQNPLTACGFCTTGNHTVERQLFSKSEWARAKYGNRARCKLCVRGRNLQNRYKISNETHAHMLKQQNDRCVTCQQPFNTLSEAVVDHDHKTGEVRGLLCNGCNTAIGLAKEDPLVCFRLAMYVLYHHTARGKNAEEAAMVMKSLLAEGGSYLLSPEQLPWLRQNQ